MLRRCSNLVVVVYLYFVVPDIYYSNVVKELLESYSEIINLLLKLLIAGKKFPVGLKKLFLNKYQLVVEVRFTFKKILIIVPGYVVAGLGKRTASLQ